MAKTTQASRINRQRAETRVLLHLMYHPKLSPNVLLDYFASAFGQFMYNTIATLNLEGVHKISPAMIEDYLDPYPEHVGNFTKLSTQYESYGSLTPAKQHDLYVTNRDKLEKLYESEELMLLLEMAIGSLEAGKHPDDVLLELKSMKTISAGKVIPYTKYVLEDIFKNTTNNIKTNISRLDYLGGLGRQNMIAISADSGMQKTMFSLWFIMHILMINPTLKAVYFEKEMPVQDIAVRMVSFLTKRPIQEILSMFLNDEPLTKASLLAAYAEASEKDVYKSLMDRLKIIPASHFNSAKDMWKIVEREQADIWVLDYATMLMREGAEKNYDLFMKNELLIMKNMLQQTNTIGIVLSQLKQTNTVELRKYKVPLVNDMEYGKTLKQFSTYVFALFSPRHYYPDDSKFGYNWFYLVPNKTRNGSLEPIPFLAEPSICTYNIPDGREESNMLGWFSNYRRYNIDKNK